MRANKDVIIFPHQIAPGAPPISGEGKHDYLQNYLRIQFVEHKNDMSGYRVNMNPPKERINKTIYLPFELEYFRYMFDMEYRATDLKAFNTPLYEAAQKSGGTVDSILDTIKQGLTTEDGAKDLAKAAGQFGIGLAVESLMNADTKPVHGAKFSVGVAYNTNPRMMFDGIGTKFRTISINWDLMPKNVEEAKDVYDIESAFYQYALPKKFNVDEEGNEDQGWKKYFYAYTYPNKLLIQPFVGGKEYNKHRFFPLVVVALTIAHSGGGPNMPNFYEDEEGRKYPVKTSIQCTLQETKIATRQDVEYLTGLSDTPTYI